MSCGASVGGATAAVVDVATGGSTATSGASVVSTSTAVTGVVTAGAGAGAGAAAMVTREMDATVVGAVLAVSPFARCSGAAALAATATRRSNGETLYQLIR